MPKLVITEYHHSANQTTYLFTGLFEEMHLVEAHFEKKTRPSILGNIYIGRVQKVVKNLNAAFIEIQPGQNGYCNLEQEYHPVYIKKGTCPTMAQGDEVLVQVSRENIKTKLPALTTNLNFTGKYCVLTTGDKKLGISGKIRSEKRQTLQDLFADKITDDFGIIVRTNAKDASVDDILKEFSRLKQELEQLLSEARYRTCFSCLKQSEPEYMRTIQNTRYEQLEEIITDIPEIYEQIQEFQKEDALLRNISLTLYEDSMLSLSSLYNVSKQIERALDKRVWLPSGGYLVIEPTEALTVIDVNTGKDVNKRKKQEHFLKVNKEAARMAAKQLRLRNLSGIIIIDFIDMKQEEDRKELLSYLKKEVQLDPVPVQVVDMTKLELVELTRKKVSKNLKEQLT